MKFKVGELVWLIVDEPNNPRFPYGRYEGVIAGFNKEGQNDRIYPYSVDVPELCDERIVADERVLRKRYPPADESFDELMKSLKQGETVKVGKWHNEKTPHQERA